MRKILIADGYNLIFSDYSIFNKGKRKRKRKINISDARESLLEILSNYASYKGMQLIVIFDAYRVPDGIGSIFQYDRYTQVLYTSQNETADTLIERTVHELRDEYEIQVATSDRSQQDYVMSQGASRMSSRELWLDVLQTDEKLYNEHIKKHRVNDPLMLNMETTTLKQLEKIRKGLLEK